MGRDSVVVLLICLVCTITMGVSLLSFRFYVSVCSWYICTGIASTFIYASFSASMRAAMPCFLGTNLARLIATSCPIIEAVPPYAALVLIPYIICAS